MTIILALSPVPFWGKESMTVQEHVKFMGSFRVLHQALGQRFLVGAREVGLFVSCNALVLKSSTPSAHYCLVLSGTGLALGEAVVPQHVGILSMELSQFFQTTY